MTDWLADLLCEWDSDLTTVMTHAQLLAHRAVACFGVQGCCGGSCLSPIRLCHHMHFYLSARGTHTVGKELVRFCNRIWPWRYSLCDVCVMRAVYCLLVTIAVVGGQPQLTGVQRTLNHEDTGSTLLPNSYYCSLSRLAQQSAQQVCVGNAKHHAEHTPRHRTAACNTQCEQTTQQQPQTKGVQDQHAPNTVDCKHLFFTHMHTIVANATHKPPTSTPTVTTAPTKRTGGCKQTRS